MEARFARSRQIANQKSKIKNSFMRLPISEYVPQVARPAEPGRVRRGAVWAWALTASGVLVVLGLIVLAPWARANGYPLLGAVVYKGFSGVCHQIPERSFHLEGFPLAVCARCFGLYAGAAAGVLLYPLARGLARRDAPGRFWLFAAAAPTTVDFALGFFGVWENTHLSRFLTAVLLGAAAAFYVVPAALDLGYRRSVRRALRGASA
jgi:uncharacterized membrane protein